MRIIGYDIKFEIGYFKIGYENNFWMKLFTLRKIFEFENEEERDIDDELLRERIDEVKVIKMVKLFFLFWEE